MTIIAAFLASALIGFGALAVDVGIWKTNQAAMQGAADQAAYAASYNVSSGISAAQKEGAGAAAANGFVGGVDGVTVAINIPPLTGPNAGMANAIEAIITQPQASFLRGVVSNSPVNASGRAVVAPVTGPTCIMALEPSGYGINLTGAGAITAVNCDVLDDSVSSSANCDVGVVGVAAIAAYDIFLGQPACPLVAISAADKLKAPAAAAANPYAGYTTPAAASSCKSTGIGLIAPVFPVTLTTPGTYCDFVTVGALTLNLGAPGVYIFASTSSAPCISVTGAFSLSGGSNNVTVVMAPSSCAGGATMMVTGAVSINLNCVRTGPTAGVALWLEGDQSFSLTGAASLTIGGAFYAPDSAVTLTGAASSPCTQLIVSSLTVTGAINLQHNCAGYGVQDAIIGYKLVE